MTPFLSHASLRRVLQSLIESNLQRQSPGASPRSLPVEPWADDLVLHEYGTNALGCDSLEMLQLSSAVNEMFHLHETGSETRLLQSPSFGGWLGLIEEAWKNGVEHITVATSGSIGQARYCSHAFDFLNREAAYLAECFASRRRIVAFTPAHHIYGLLFTGLLADRLNIPVVKLQGAGTRVPKGPADSSVLRSGDLAVSFPEGWSWMDRSIRTIPSDVEGVTSTAPCPRSLVDSLAVGKLSKFVEVYGSSETAGIGMRVWPEPRYQLMPHWQRLTSSSEQAQRLQHVSGHQADLMDHLQFFDDGTFLVQGRKDACVQVGGVNVSPASIEARLRAQPGVAEVSVRLMRPDEGRRLKCFIVPLDGYGPRDLEPSLSKEIRSWPVAAERPREISYGPGLPRNHHGKLTDW